MNKGVARLAELRFARRHSQWCVAQSGLAAGLRVAAG
jgi:hypothetical protein